MEEKIDEQLIRTFKLHFPTLVDDVVKYTFDNVLEELIFVLSDGSVWCYEDIDNSIHRLPNNLNNMSDSEYKSEFGRRMKKLMFRRHITQEELTKKTGITQCMISRYVNGISIPTFINVDKIARALNCSVDDLRHIRKE